MESAEVGAEEEGAGEGDAEHFVGVDGYGVGEVGAVEFGGVGGGEDGGAAPGGVDVEPEVVGAADGGEWGEGVVGAEHGGAGGGVEVEWSVAFLLGFDDEAFQGGRVHGAVCEDGDGPDGGGAEAKGLGGLFDAVVAVRAGEQDQFEIVGGVAAGLGGGEERIARDHYGCGVGH